MSSLQGDKNAGSHSDVNTGSISDSLKSLGLQSVLAPLIGPKKELHDLHGRVAVVTGGANGIGYEISRAFASVGCRVIMTNRKEEQGQDAIDKIKAETPGAQVEWIGCDLGNLKEVKETFTKIREQESRLDLLILSAGINTNAFGYDSDGIERIFGVNWLGHFYVLNLLYPLIRATSKMPGVPTPRIVMESSEMHRGARPDTHFGSLEEINQEDMDPTRLYGRTKLAMILGTKYGLLDKVIKPQGDNIYALTVHPGVVATNMQNQWQDAYPGVTGKLLSYLNFAASRNVEQGAYSALYAATSPEVEEKGWNGYYFGDPGTPGKETAQACDKYLGIALWDLSKRIIEAKVGPDALTPWDHVMRNQGSSS